MGTAQAPSLQLEQFFQRHPPRHCKLLLAVSGGVDSLSLFHLLLAKREKFSYALHVVHVDHRWRRQSAAESRLLQQLMARLQVPCHHCRLSEPLPTADIENVLRQRRWRYFQQVYKQIGADALLLGHQADDRVETVLKRIFEGSALSKWPALLEERWLGEMRVWRPLLRLRKEQLLRWARSQMIPFCHDPTNTAQRFLRARLRQQLLPSLEEKFGKRIHANICYLGDEAAALGEYLQRRLAPLLQRVKRGPLGSWYDLRDQQIDPYEWRWVARFACDQHQITLSREQLRQLGAALQRGAPWSTLTAVERIVVARRMLFVLRSDLPAFASAQPLVSGEMRLGEWCYRIRQESTGPRFAGWPLLWADGSCRFSLPAGDYRLAPADGQLPFRGHALADWWRRQRVPRFLQTCYPVVIARNQQIVIDLLTATSLLARGEDEQTFTLAIDRPGRR